MRVAAFQSDGLLKIEERDLPKIGPGELLLKVQACGLCGTDILKVQKRSIPVGTVLGHEVAGVIAQVGAGVKNFKEGDRVMVAHHVPCGECHFCRHKNFSMCAQFKETNLDPGGFAEFLRIPEKHVTATTLKIPEGLSFEEASFTEPIACCLRAVHRSALLPGDSVLIIGLGSIGLILTQLFRHFSMQVFVTDLMEDRKNLAKEWGATLFEPGIEKRLAAGGFDMVLLTAGNGGLLNRTLKWVRPGGKIHLFSHLSEDQSPFDVNSIYHRELEVVATYSSSPQDLKEAMNFLETKKIDVKKLISASFPLEKLQEAIEKMSLKKIMKGIIQL
ncbi:MAG: alcohol dehydrogenase catalytic domain-containing protein [Deltaproteobacteria bacterium]|nr:alcohol dehydrogenase catalytic domain-containing protein [Deltaproteobacteria bacterium]